MADDNKIEVQIVLDNGSVVKGFAKMEQAAEQAGKTVEKSFSGKVTEELSQKVNNLAGFFSDIPGPVKAATIAVTAFGLATKEAFDQVVKGEKLKLIETQFQNLSASVGIASDQLSTRFRESLGGLADDSEAFQVLNEGISKLGANANQLPEVFELARKASNLFGGEAIDNFRKIEEAIASGNTKALKDIGLKVDQKKALDDFAKSIGTTADLLNESGRQQAILNAVLQKGEERFKAIALENGTATESLTKLKVTLNNIGDEIAIKVSNAFSGVFKTIIDGANSAATALLKAFEPESVKTVESELKKVNDRLKEINQSGLASSLNGEIELLNIQSKQLQNRLDILKATEEEQRKSGAAQSPAQTAAISAITGGGANFVDREKLNAERLAAEDKFNADLIQKENERDAVILQNKLVGANAETAARLQAENEEQIHQQRLADIIIENADNKYITTAQTNALIEAENARSAAVQANIEKQKTKNIEAENKNRLNAIGGVLGQIATLSDNSNKELAAIGKAAAITQATINGYLAVTNALAVPPYPLGLALAVGAGVAAAANIAKIAATGPGGGSSAFSNTLPTSGGGVAAGIEAPVTGPTTALAEPVNTGPKVEVNIAGNVFDSDATGSRIVDLINNAFDQKGAVVTGAV